MATISKDSFTRSTPQTRQAKGPLVRVELQPGRFVKMHKADADAQGLAYEGQKAQPPAQNKMLPPAGDKAVAVAPPAEPEGKAEPDDFATIDGVGKATARALVAHGVKSFDQLKAAGTLDYVTPAAMNAIEEWRKRG